MYSMYQIFLKSSSVMCLLVLREAQRETNDRQFDILLKLWKLLVELELVLPLVVCGGGFDAVDGIPLDDAQARLCRGQREAWRGHPHLSSG